MNCFDLSNYHPGCSLELFGVGNSVFCWCPKHRVVANVQAVGLAIHPVSSFIEDPAVPKTLVAQPTKGIPGSDLWKGVK